MLPAFEKSLLLHKYHIRGDILQGLCTAHCHGISQFCTDLFDVQLNTFFSAAIDHGNEGTADDDSVSTQSQSLEHIHTGTDAAVDDAEARSAPESRSSSPHTGSPGSERSQTAAP